MVAGARRLLLATLVLLVAPAAACTPATSPEPPPEPTTSRALVDDTALEAEIERAIATGPASLDNVRAVLVSVDGETRVAHYRGGFTEDSHAHVFSVTKSVLATLVGIAMADGLIDDLDQTLGTLLPEHHSAMSDDTANVTLRHLMTMTAAFTDDPQDAWKRSADTGRDYIDIVLERRLELHPGTSFSYSDANAHLVSAVLAAALERADGDAPRTVLDYARAELFDPLGISTRPAYAKPLPDLFAPEFAAAGFGWGTDPDGIHLGGVGLRLTAPDLVKLGELYRQGGTWQGRQLVPASWIEETTTRPASATSDPYALLWWTFDAPVLGYTAAGYGGQRIVVFPEDGLVIAIMSEVPLGGGMTNDDLAVLEEPLVSAFFP